MGLFEEYTQICNNGIAAYGEGRDEEARELLTKATQMLKMLILDEPSEDMRESYHSILEMINGCLQDIEQKQTIVNSMKGKLSDEPSVLQSVPVEHVVLPQVKSTKKKAVGKKNQTINRKDNTVYVEEYRPEIGA